MVLLNWLESRRSESGVTPYRREASRFAEIVTENKKRQGNEILTK